MYEYHADVLEVLDGDTVRVRVELGCDVAVRLTIRLYGINAPELAIPEGLASKEHLIALLPPNGRVLLQTIKDRKEKYGRYLGILVDPTALSMSINERMLADGFALRYVP